MSVCMRELDSLELELLDICELPCGYKELNQDLLEEQLVLLTAESSLQPHFTHCVGVWFCCVNTSTVLHSCRVWPHPSGPSSNLDPVSVCRQPHPSQLQVFDSAMPQPPATL